MTSRFTRRQWLTVIVISIADFCNAICVALQAPFFPHEAENKGCTATEYGLVFGIFELVVFIISPIYGAHLNRLGPKLVFNSGILTTATCAILFGLLDKVDGHIPFVTLAFTIRIIEAMGNAAFLTASFAIIAKEFPDNVATMFASLEAFFGLGLIVGPMVGGLLYSWGGYSLPFAVLGTTLIFSAILCYLTLPRTSDDEDIKTTGPSVFSLLKIPGVLVAALSIVSISISIGFLQATLEPHLRDKFNFTPVVLGLMFIINGGIYALTAPGWGWLCDRPSVKPKYITCFGHLFVVASFTLIGPAPFLNMPTTLWVTVTGLVLHGMGIGSILVSTFTDALGTAISSGLPNSIETYGLVSGMWTSVFALGAFIGPTVSGLLFDYTGFEDSTLFIIVLHTLMAIVLILFLCTCDRYKMEVSVSAGDLLQLDGTLDESVLIGEKFMAPVTRTKSRRYGISVEKSRPPAMNSLIACSSYKNRRSPWSQRTPRYRPTYGSLDTRFRASLSVT